MSKRKLNRSGSSDYEDDISIPYAVEAKIKRAKPDSKIDKFYGIFESDVHLDGKKDFLQLLTQKDNESTLMQFLLSKDETWNPIKDIFLITDPITDQLRIDMDLTKDISSQYQEQKFYGTFKLETPIPSDSSDSEYLQLHSSRLAPRLKPVVATQVIRGEIMTYAQSMMGGFKYTIKKIPDLEGNLTSILCISEDAKIIRPKGIVGNLGKSMGSHVVPFSEFIQDICSRTRGKEIFEAIEVLRNKIAENTSDPAIDRYQGLIEAAQNKLTGSERNFEAQVDAFAFLCWEFIPSIVAIHNQGLGTAFREKKTSEELLVEARIVNNFLSRDRGDISEDIKSFIEVIDYKPVVDPVHLEPRESRRTGTRTNQIDDLSDIMGDVVDSFFTRYGVDAKDSLNIAEELINELLQQKGWLEYYSEHPEDLGNESRLGHSVSMEELREYVLGYVKRNRAILIVDNESARDSSSPSEHSHKSEARSRRPSADEDISNSAIGVAKAIDNAESEKNNLKRFEKLSISSQAYKPKFIDILCDGLSKAEKDIIAIMRESEASQIKQPNLKGHSADIKPKITLMPENNHKSDHKNNAQELIQMINSGRIDDSTAICLERKEYGANFGMHDVRLLANLIEHNQKNPDTAIAIPVKIQNSLIYQDAILYNVAKAHGVEVIGIEGKGLSHSKESPEYNATREAHMAERIEQISSSGRNVIFPVGAAHIDGLKAMLPSAQISSDIKASNEKTKFDHVVSELKERLQNPSPILNGTSRAVGPSKSSSQSFSR